MKRKRKYRDIFFIRSEKSQIELFSLLSAIIAPCFVLFWVKLNLMMPLDLKLCAWIISLSFSLLYCLMYLSSFIRNNLGYFFYVICYITSAFTICLALINNFSEGYSLVLMLVVFYIALTFEKMSSLIYYVVTVLVLVGLAVYIVKIDEKLSDKNGLTIAVSLIIFSVIVLINLFIRNEHKRALRESKKDYQRLLDISPDGIVVYEEGNIVYANEAIAKLANLKSKDELIGKSVFEFIHPRDYEDAVNVIEEALKGSETGYSEEILTLANNVSVEIEVANIMTSYNGKNAIMTIMRGIGERKRMEEKINQMALYDPLTTLPNRNFFNSYLKNSLLEAEKNEHTLAIMFIDLDRFKIINDTMGHNFGDEVLSQASQEIKKCLSENDFVSRYGGDEFIVVLYNACKLRTKETAQKIIDGFSKSFNIMGYKIYITPSIGISYYPTDGSDVETLVKYADTAMYEAKAFGRNNYKFYTSKMNYMVSRRMQMESGLRRALQNQEFVVHYQPQIDLKSGNICGAEALIRWSHPEFGTIPPNEFIPLAEETGLIIPIGEWVLKTACSQSIMWQKSGMKPINIAVNVSNQQLRHEGYINSVREALKESGLEMRYLELEITESILKNMDELKPVFDELTSIGVKLSVDDFGVGYSSLSVLQHIIIDNLKIDQSFIRGISDNPKTAAIVKTIIDMGKHLNCNIIAEGIETKEQESFLIENNCNIGQGYLFSRPIEASAFEKLIKEWKSNL